MQNRLLACLCIVVCLSSPLVCKANQLTPRQVYPAYKTKGTPEEFLRDLYERFDRANLDKPDLDGDDAWALADSTLLALINKEESLADGVGAYDADPVCECQDWDKITVHKVELSNQRRNRVDATVFFELGEGWPEQLITYELVRIRGEWRIHNLVSVHGSYQPYYTNMIDTLKAAIEKGY